MFSAPPNAVSCTHRCHRMQTASFSFNSTHADSFSFLPINAPAHNQNSLDLPLAILRPVTRIDLPQLGPSPLPEPPHSSICRTPLPSVSMASHMHHLLGLVGHCMAWRYESLIFYLLVPCYRILFQYSNTFNFPFQSASICMCHHVKFYLH